jgi:hypothetical protein
MLFSLCGDLCSKFTGGLLASGEVVMHFFDLFILKMLIHALF